MATVILRRPRLRLREATAPDHEQVDAAFSRFDLGTRAGYIAFLQAQAAAFLPVERAIEDNDVAAILSDWPARRRSHLLTADLAALGAKPDGGIAAPPLPSSSAVLGAVYVLEGSRLGGRLLARSVPAELPRSFIGSGDPALWRRLIEALDKAIATEEQMYAATVAARAVFACFSQGARRHTKDAHVDQTR